MTASLHPYPAYKPSGIPWLGDVPQNWGVGRLKAHLLLNDSGVWGENFDEQGTIVLRSTEQTIDGGWRISNPAKIRLSQVERDSAFLEANDLLVTKSSGSSAHIGKTTIVTSSIAAMNCCFSNFIQRLRLNSQVSPLLIWYILNSNVGREQLVIKSTTTTGLANLNGKIISDLLLPLPPLPEQDAIVRYLNHVDRRIRRYVSAKRKLIALLEEEKQAIVNRAVTRGLDPNVRLKPSGVEWLGDVPEHWAIRTLGQIADSFRTGPFGSMLHQSDYVEDGTPVINPVHMRGGTIVEDPNCTVSAAVADRLSSYRLDLHDLVFSRRGELGRCALVRSRETSWICGTGSIRVRITHGDMEPEFLIQALQPQWVGEYLSLVSVGATMPNLNTGILKGVPILVPPIQEQRDLLELIGRQSREIDAAIARARRQIELVQEYSTRLIADVVTGKLDVRAAAAQLPEEDDDQDPIDEGAIMLDNMDDGSSDVSQLLEEEQATEREVTA